MDHKECSRCKETKDITQFNCLNTSLHSISLWSIEWVPKHTRKSMLAEKQLRYGKNPLDKR